MIHRQLTNTVRNFSAPCAVLLARDKWIADDFVTALAPIFRERADLVSLNGARRVLVRSDQSSSVHPVVSSHRQDAVHRQNRLGASNFLAFRRRVAPLTRLDTRSSRDSIESVSVGAAVGNFRSEISRVLRVFNDAEWNRCQGLAVDD